MSGLLYQCHLNVKGDLTLYKGVTMVTDTNW